MMQLCFKNNSEQYVPGEVLILFLIIIVKNSYMKTFFKLKKNFSINFMENLGLKKYPNRMERYYFHHLQRRKLGLIFVNDTASSMFTLWQSPDSNLCPVFEFHQETEHFQTERAQTVKSQIAILGSKTCNFALEHIS